MKVLSGVHDRLAFAQGEGTTRRDASATVAKNIAILPPIVGQHMIQAENHYRLMTMMRSQRQQWFKLKSRKMAMSPPATISQPPRQMKEQHF